MSGFLKARWMVRFRLWLLMTLLLPLVPAPALSSPTPTLLPCWFTHAEPALPLPPVLARALLEGSPAPWPIIVILRGVPSLSSMALPDGPRARRQVIVETLQDAFARDASALAPLLERAEADGDLLARRNLWIIHGMALTVRPSLLEQLRRHPAVAEIRLDERHRYLPEETEASEAPLEGSPWGVAAIGAPQVWAALRITGTGAIVAGMDTGVDWMHPALHDHYFGLHGALADHRHAWFDAVNGGAYPYDDHGHGTHTVGTAVGETIGVAPGARWMAVKVLSGQGYGYDSWIHAGFQWLLAPGGDPTFAPDVVNCSWGTLQGTMTTFQDDVEALEAAGIFVALAAGNSGPDPQTIYSPASLPGAFAIGAIAEDESVAYFSSRGPSPWGEVKPYVVAPGVHILSALPGGRYAAWNGTSMATPHVSGLVALMRAVSPTIEVASIAEIITGTARPLSLTLPNNESGWGLIDAVAAVGRVADAGSLVGHVRSVGGGPLAGAEITVAPRDGLHPSVAVRTDEEGRYAVMLVSDLYTATATAFGYHPLTKGSIPLTAAAVVSEDFVLTALPTGTLRGRITVSPTGNAPTRALTLRPLGTPLSTVPDGMGWYTMSLPSGLYTMEVRGNGYRLLTATVRITAGMTARRDFTLTVAPTLLLVDEGTWYYDSRVELWRAALDALGYAYTILPITAPPVGSTFSETLHDYDVVLWSSPRGSPGLVGAGEALESYLAAGGRLLLSGQDIAAWDGPLYIGYRSQPYFRRDLDVRPLADDARSLHLEGLALFTGESVTLTEDAFSPDVVEPQTGLIGEPLWRYAGDGVGGIAAHRCVPYRALYFAFGLEHIASASTRDEVIDRSIDWLAAPLSRRGIQVITPPEQQIGLPGSQLTFTVVLRHLGLVGTSRPITLSLTGGPWTGSVSPTVAVLRPCERLTATVRVTIPTTAGVDARAVHTLTVRSPLIDRPLTLTVRSKTPAPLLVIDGHRWYAAATARYTTTLRAMGLPYDLMRLENDGGPPPDDLLARYPLLFWFTAYDWYHPVSAEAEAALLRYLDSGGHLLLSSQDFLGSEPRPLAVRMGVAAAVPDVRSPQVHSAPDLPASGWWSASLEPLFPLWGDRLDPWPTATVVMRDSGEAPVAVAAADGSALFTAFALAALPDGAREAAMRGALGYLSPLGASTLSYTPTVVAPGSRLTFTLVARNRESEQVAASVWQRLPAPTYTLAALPPPLSYDPAAQAVHWSGWLSSPLTMTWAVTVGSSAASVLDPPVVLGLPHWGLDFPLHARVALSAGDLGASGWLSTTPIRLPWQQAMTLTFRLRNRGLTTTAGTLTFYLAPALTPLSATATTVTGTLWHAWSGLLPAGASHDVTVALRAMALDLPLRLDALVNEMDAGILTRRYLFAALVEAQPHRTFLPVIFR